MTCDPVGKSNSAVRTATVKKSDLELGREGFSNSFTQHNEVVAREHGSPWHFSEAEAQID